MKLLFLISGLFLLVSCSKSNVAPSINQDKAYITKILSITCSNSTTDSALIHLDTIEKSFSPPINEFTHHLFSKTFDSLYLKLDTNSHLNFKKPLLLPAIVINTFTWLSTDSDSIRIGDFETAKGFQSKAHQWDISEIYTGLINKYRLTGKYRRIYYNVKVKMDVRDNKGRTWTLTGHLKGSKVTEPHSEVTTW